MKPLLSQITVPGDKSISHRALILSAIAKGPVHISNLLESDDTMATRAILKKVLSDRKTPLILDCQNSGTTMRLMAGLLCALNLPCTLVGDPSLMRRPMGRVVNPLRQMGFDISMTEDGVAPLVIQAAKKTLSTERIQFELTVASAQVKSAILLANVFREGVTEIIEPVVTRNHTEIMLEQFGAKIYRVGNKITLLGGKTLTASTIDVPGDFSSAAFFIVAALIVPGSNVLIKNVGVNPTRTGLLTILEKMGAAVQLKNLRESSGEKVADIHAFYTPLTGVDIPSELVPLAIDEFPIIFIAAAFAKGKTTVRGAKELRVKESDRLKSMSINLNRLGIKATVFEDGIEIIGGKMQSGTVESFSDHRIAMAFLIAKIASSSAITVKDADVVSVSFPDFFNQLNQLNQLK